MSLLFSIITTLFLITSARRGHGKGKGGHGKGGRGKGGRGKSGNGNQDSCNGRAFMKMIPRAQQVSKGIARTAPQDRLNAITQELSELVSPNFERYCNRDFCIQGFTAQTPAGAISKTGFEALALHILLESYLIKNWEPTITCTKTKELRSVALSDLTITSECVNPTTGTDIVSDPIHAEFTFNCDNNGKLIEANLWRECLPLNAFTTQVSTPQCQIGAGVTDPSVAQLLGLSALNRKPPKDVPGMCNPPPAGPSAKKDTTTRTDVMRNSMENRDDIEVFKIAAISIIATTLIWLTLFVMMKELNPGCYKSRAPKFKYKEIDVESSGLSSDCGAVNQE